MVQTFTLCILVLMTLIIMSRVIHMRQLFLGLSLNLVDFISLFIYLIPSFLLIVFPISCMLSVFLTYLRASTDRELIALKAGGISIYQLLFAPTIFSIICMLLAFVVSVHGISWGMGNFRSLVLQIASTRAKVVVQPGVFNQDLVKGLTFFARKVDPKTGKLSQVLFEDNTENNNDVVKSNSLTILSSEGEIVTDDKKGELVFNFYNGQIYRIDKEQTSILSFKKYNINIDLNSIITGVRLGDIKPRELSWNKLLALSKTKVEEDEEKNFRRVLVEIQKRLTLPVACLVLGLFAVPLACAFEGTRQQFGILLTLILFLVYYSIFSFALNMGETGKIAPEVGLWLANILFFLAFIIGIYFTGKERILGLQSLISSLNQLFIKIRKKV